MAIRTPSSHACESAGYSLIEVMIVVMLVAIVSAMAVPVSTRAIRASRSDSSASAAEKALDTARDRAVAERRNIVLTFIAPSTIRLDRQEINAAGTVIGTTTINTFTLETGHQFLKFASVPDTPDAFGASSSTSFSGTPPVMFTSDGSLVDSAGDIVNGSIFIALPGQTESARAVTIFGVTGLTRNWKWRGTKWME